MRSYIDEGFFRELTVSISDAAEVAANVKASKEDDGDVTSVTTYASPRPTLSSCDHVANIIRQVRRPRCTQEAALIDL